MLGIFGPNIKKCEKIFQSKPDDLENSHTLVDLYLKENRVKEAIEVYETTVKYHQDDIMLKRKLGELYFRTSQADKLNILYAQMFRSNSKSLKYIMDDYESGFKILKKSQKYVAMKGLADILRESGMLKQAIQYYVQVAEIEKQDIEVHQSMADIYFELGKLKEASVVYNALIKLRPEEGSYYMRLAEILCTEKRYVEMRDTYEKVLHFYPEKISEITEKVETAAKEDGKNPELLVSLARIYQFGKKTDKAAKIYYDVLAINPEDMLISENLFELLIKSKRFDDACEVIGKYFSGNDFAHLVGYYERVLAAGPQCERALIEIYNLYKENGADEKAEKILSRMKKTDTKSVDMHLEIASKAIEEGKIDEAVEELISARALEPDNIKIMEELGLLYIQQDNVDEAINIYTEISEVDDNNHNAYKELAYLYLQKRKNSEAYKYFKKYTNRQPEDVFVLRDFAFLLIEENRLNEAKDILKGLLKVDPKNVEAIKELAEIFIREKKYNYAEELYNKLLKIEDTFENQLELGKLHITSRQFKRATIEFDEVLKKCSNYREILEIYEETVKEYVNDSQIIYIVQAADKLYEKMDRLDDAIKMFLYVLKNNSSNVQVMETLYEAYMKKKDYTSAYKISRMMYQNAPEAPQVLVNLAYAMYMLGEESKAAVLYDQRIKNLQIQDETLLERIDKIQKAFYLDEISKYNRQIDACEGLERLKLYYKIGELYYRCDEYDNAITTFQKLQHEDIPFKVNVIYLNGLCFLKKKLKDIALKHFMSISQAQCPSDVKKELIYKAGRLLEKDRFIAEAVTVYQELLSLDINYKDTDKRIKSLADTAQSKMFGGGSAGGSISDRYDDLTELGKGGMGMVYKAKDKRLGRTVALKVLKKELAENKKALQRFVREAQASAILNHPNIIAVYDVEEMEEVFITMEFVDGKSIMNLIEDNGKLSIEETLNYGIQVCIGLHYAHEKGIVHRDIKPDNIMVTREGVAKIADFGLAKIETNSVTKAGTIMGTPYYMSPEQIKGQVADRRSDIYSLGITFYQMLCGEVPFAKGQVVYHHIHTAPEPLVNRVPGISQELSDTIMKCIEKEVDHRFQTCEEIENAFRSLV